MFAGLLRIEEKRSRAARMKSVYFTLFLLVAFFARSNPRVHGVVGLVVQDEIGANVMVLMHIE